SIEVPGRHEFISQRHGQADAEAAVLQTARAALEDSDLTPRTPQGNGRCAAGDAAPDNADVASLDGHQMRCSPGRPPATASNADIRATTSASRPSSRPGRPAPDPLTAAQPLRIPSSMFMTAHAAFSSIAE